MKKIWKLKKHQNYNNYNNINDFSDLHNIRLKNLMNNILGKIFGKKNLKLECFLALKKFTKKKIALKILMQKATQRQTTKTCLSVLQTSFTYWHSLTKIQKAHLQSESPTNLAKM